MLLKIDTIAHMIPMVWRDKIIGFYFGIPKRSL